MEFIKENIQVINENIERAALNSSRKKEDITLLGVTKTVDTDAILEAINCGITDVGENKPQELARKYDVIGDKVRWHLIGTLQTNKVKYIIDKVSMIHSLDREALCEEIQKRAEKIDKTIDCLVQVNISKEESKHGLDKENVVEFIKNTSKKQLGNITVKIGQLDKDGTYIMVDSISLYNILKPSEDIKMEIKALDNTKSIELLGYSYDDIKEKANINIDLKLHKASISG